jgi:hypothetical protein
MSTPSTSLEHVHELAPQVKVARARAGVLLLIVSDALVVLAIMAGGGYLRALNTEGQYKAPGSYGPPYVPELLIMIGLLLSGLSYYWWERRASKPGETGQTPFFLLALMLMLAAGVGQTWLAATLRYGSPIHAYESIQFLIAWFTVIHVLLAAIIGVLLAGRILRGRLAGHEFIVEVTGYWWYYTVIASVLLWLFAAYLT